MIKLCNSLPKNEPFWRYSLPETGRRCTRDFSYIEFHRGQVWASRWLPNWYFSGNPPSGKALSTHSRIVEQLGAAQQSCLYVISFRDSRGTTFGSPNIPYFENFSLLFTFKYIVKINEPIKLSLIIPIQTFSEISNSLVFLCGDFYYLFDWENVNSGDLLYHRYRIYAHL